MPAKAARAPARMRKSKAEVHKEFENIREEVEASHENIDVKTEEAARIRETEVRQGLEGVTVENVVQRISGLGLEISKSLSGISAKLLEEVNLLASVCATPLRSNVRSLSGLHKIDVAATALDQIVRGLRPREAAAGVRNRGAAGGLGGGIPRAERERKEQEENSRSSASARSKTTNTRRTWSARRPRTSTKRICGCQEKKNQERQETLEKSWQQREAALKEREEELRAAAQGVRRVSRRG